MARMMIDATVQADLRDRFNPEGSDLRKIQLRMLEMLKYIDNVCQAHGIKYWLSSGTCLGAIRHGGFIPWDDDVDIEMLTNDFERFKAVLSSDTDSGYVLQTAETDPDYLQRFAKLRDLHSFVDEGSTDRRNHYKGCYVDIFVITPSSSRKLRRICGWIWNYSLFPLVKINNTTVRHLIVHSVRRVLLTLFKGLSYLEARSRRGVYRHIIGCGFTLPRQLEEIEDVVYVDFEDTTLPVPKGWDGYLKKLYGNYNELPEQGEIIPHFRRMRVF